MTEQEWLRCSDPEILLRFLRGKMISDRKLRLFAVACCRRLFQAIQVDARDVHAVDVAERYADGASTTIELDEVARYVPAPPSAHRTAAFACRDAASLEDGILLADCAAENAA